MPGSRPTAAVPGAGFVGPLHVEALRRIGIEVAGVVGSSPERARAKAGRRGLRAYASLEDLLGGPARARGRRGEHGTAPESTVPAAAAEGAGALLLQPRPCFRGGAGLHPARAGDGEGRA